MPTDLKKQAEFNTLVDAMVGNLRLSLTGPGAMTEKEREMIRNTLPRILNPLEGYDIQMVKLNALKNQLKESADKKIKAYGFEREGGAAPAPAAGGVFMEMGGKRKVVPAYQVKQWQAQGAKIVQ
jgi:hypothetical protein